jgi:hypothetical protein
MIKNTKPTPLRPPVAIHKPEGTLVPKKTTLAVPAEVKKKRTGLVEQKKMKLIKGKPGRSAKNAVIGRKPGQ